MTDKTKAQVELVNEAIDILQGADDIVPVSQIQEFPPPSHWMNAFFAWADDAKLSSIAHTAWRDIERRVKEFSNQPSDDELRNMWKAAGGKFFGPNIEHGSMPETDLLTFMRKLCNQGMIPPLVEPTYHGSEVHRKIQDTARIINAAMKDKVLVPRKFTPEMRDAYNKVCNEGGALKGQSAWLVQKAWDALIKVAEQQNNTATQPKEKA